MTNQPTFWITTAYDDVGAAATEWTSTDDRYRVLRTDSTVTIHDHTDTFADNPTASHTFTVCGNLAAWEVADFAADDLVMLQPDGTDWLAWATHYLTELADDYAAL